MAAKPKKNIDAKFGKNLKTIETQALQVKFYADQGAAVFRGHPLSELLEQPHIVAMRDLRDSLNRMFEGIKE